MTKFPNIFGGDAAAATFLLYVCDNIVFRFVFMALMEYCLVNIVLGDSDAPKPPQAPKTDNIFDMAAKENSRLLSGAPKKAPPLTPAQKARNRAINIDRFSRVFFPLLFAVLNGTYWFLFAEYI